MGKFDAIDIVFMSLISFYLLIFSLILIFKIRDWMKICPQYLKTNESNF